MCVPVHVSVCVGGWVTAGALSSVFSIINPSEDSQKGVSSMPDALSISCSVSFTHRNNKKFTKMLLALKVFLYMRSVN